jgi:hypothetical protein
MDDEISTGKPKSRHWWHHRFGRNGQLDNNEKEEEDDGGNEGPVYARIAALWKGQMRS